METQIDEQTEEKKSLDDFQICELRNLVDLIGCLVDCKAQKYPVVTTTLLSIAWPSEFPNIFLGDTSSWCIYMCILLSRVRERKMLKFYNTSSKHDTGADNFFALTHSKTMNEKRFTQRRTTQQSYRIATVD